MRRTGGRKGLQGQCARGNVKDQMLCAGIKFDPPG